MPRIHTWFFALLASCLLLPSTTRAEETAASAFRFKDAQGAGRSINAAAHKLTAVHFWATWCAPCIKELPEVDAAQAEYGPKGFTIYAISLDGENNMAKVQKFFADHHIASLTPYVDVDNVSFQAAKAEGLPTTLFLDDKGALIHRSDGPVDWNSAETKAFILEHLK